MITLKNTDNQTILWFALPKGSINPAEALEKGVLDPNSQATIDPGTTVNVLFQFDSDGKVGALGTVGVDSVVSFHNKRGVYCVVEDPESAGSVQSDQLVLLTDLEMQESQLEPNEEATFHIKVSNTSRFSTIEKGSVFFQAGTAGSVESSGIEFEPNPLTIEALGPLKSETAKFVVKTTGATPGTHKIDWESKCTLSPEPPSNTGTFEIVVVED